MSEQNRPQRRQLKNNRPRNPQPGQPEQNPPPEGQYPPPPQPGYSQALPPHQVSEPQKIPVERKRDSVVIVFIFAILGMIAFPFVKIFQAIGYIFKIILEQVLRSIVNLIIGILLLVVFVVLVAGYIYALYLTQFDFAAAVPEMFRVFGSFFGFGS